MKSLKDFGTDQFEQKTKCTGCTACMNICPEKCITMVKDEEGFNYPSIDDKVCIKCNKCISVCPIKNDSDEKFRMDFSQKLYGAKNKDLSVRLSSSSGGVFSLLAEEIVNRNGVIFGAVYDEKWNIIHASARNNTEYKRMIGSKYAESDLKNVFEEVKHELENDVPVLFTGTPCQVAGLRCFLNRDYGNLFTCDLLCRGVNSPLIFREWLDSFNKKVNNIIFRNKSEGWHNSKLSLRLGLKTVTNNKTKKYMRLFGSHLILRPSCYFCRYAHSKRYSDITIGDFWGIEKISPEFDDNKGTSCVIINTKKGEELFSNIDKKIDKIAADFLSYISVQPSLQKPVLLPSNRRFFWKDYYKKGFKYSLQKYVGTNFYSRFLRLIQVRR